MSTDELSTTTSQVKMIPEPIFLICVPRGDIDSRRADAVDTNRHDAYRVLSAD